MFVIGDLGSGDSTYREVNIGRITAITTTSITIGAGTNNQLNNNTELYIAKSIIIDNNDHSQTLTMGKC